MGVKSITLPITKETHLQCPRALPGELLMFRIGKASVDKGHRHKPCDVQFARYEEESEKSPHQIPDKEVCPHYKEECSGCKFQNLKYGRQVMEKRRLINEVWRDKLVDFDVDRSEAYRHLGALVPAVQHRNKQFAEFVFGRDFNAKPELGFWREAIQDVEMDLYHNSPEVIGVTSCSLIDKLILRCYTAVRKAYKRMGALPRGNREVAMYPDVISRDGVDHPDDLEINPFYEIASLEHGLNLDGEQRPISYKDPAAFKINHDKLTYWDSRTGQGAIRKLEITVARARNRRPQVLLNFILAVDMKNFKEKSKNFVERSKILKAPAWTLRN